MSKGTGGGLTVWLEFRILRLGGMTSELWLSLDITTKYVGQVLISLETASTTD